MSHRRSVFFPSIQVHFDPDVRVPVCMKPDAEGFFINQCEGVKNEDQTDFSVFGE